MVVVVFKDECGGISRAQCSTKRIESYLNAVEFLFRILVVFVNTDLRN